MFGVVDLDCHEEVTPERHAEAVHLVSFLAGIGIVAYRVPSRGARGAHVWLLFRSPGVPWRDLRAFLDTFAHELRGTGCVDVFPNTTGAGGVFLPYYLGNVNAFDEHGLPVPMDGLLSNDPVLIPGATRPETKPARASWPPREWNLRGGPTQLIPEALEDVKDLLFRGPRGLLCAKMGARNKLAGMTAVFILRRGGTFDAFKEWDSANRPPLMTDEPCNLAAWWRRAERNRQRRSREVVP
jgi:hypothetical protein